MKQSFYFIVFVLLMFLTVDGCRNREGLLQPDVTSVKTTHKNQAQSHLFSNLSKFNLVSGFQTKADVTDFTPAPFDLDSLLDYSKQGTLNINGVLYREIPFMQVEEQGNVIFHDSMNYEDSSASFFGEIKRYFISVSSDHLYQEYCVTMMTNPIFLENDGKEYSFLYKRNYSGLIIFSDINGHLLDVKAYINGRIGQVFLLLPSEIEDFGEEDVKFFSLFFENDVPATKSNPITPSYCIAYRYEMLDPSYCYPHYGSGGAIGAGSDNNDPNGSLEGHNNNNYQEEYIGSENIEQPMFTVDLTTNKPDTVCMTGSGVYNYGVTLEIEPEFLELEDMPESMSEHLLFSRWVGDLKNEPSAWVSLTVNQNILSTAIFGLRLPCVNRTTGAGNPLDSMYVAASNNYGNYEGGTYGRTRNNHTKYHSGLDLSASEGTPVFSMYDGVVVRVVSDIPDQYVQNSFGNEIRIQSVIDDDVVIIQYAHLLSGNAICDGARTLMPLSVGDFVFQGEQIGYTGHSGNAYYVPNKHLHIGVAKNGEWVNPADYINGTISVLSLNQNNGLISNIICN